MMKVINYYLFEPRISSSFLCLKSDRSYKWLFFLFLEFNLGKMVDPMVWFYEPAQYFQIPNG